MARLRKTAKTTATEETPGKRLAILREQHGYRQADIADKLGISRSTYVGYETLDRTPPWELLCDIANVYDVSLDYILCRTDTPTSGKKVLVADESGQISDIWFHGSDADQANLTEYLQLCYEMFESANSAWKKRDNVGHLMQLVSHLAALRPTLREQMSALGDRLQTSRTPCRAEYEAAQEQINEDLDAIYTDIAKEAIISAL